MTRVAKNMERKNILCIPSKWEGIFLYFRLDETRPVWAMNACDLPIQVHASTRREHPFFVCVLKMSSLCFSWLSPLLLNSYINVKYGARHKLTRLITQAQSYALRVLYDTYNLRLFCFLGTTYQTSSAFVRKLSQVNEKPMIVIIISVCSQMITYKAVKANSWLRYWLRT